MKKPIFRKKFIKLFSQRSRNILFMVLLSVIAVGVVILCLTSAWQDSFGSTLEAHPWILALIFILMVFIDAIAITLFSVRQNYQLQLQMRTVEKNTLENERDEYRTFVSYFAESFLSTYYVDLKTWGFHVYTRDEYLQEKYPEVPENFLDYLDMYLKKDVHPDDVASVRDFMDPDAIRTALRSSRDYTIVFRHLGENEWRRIRMIISHGEDEDHVAVMFIDITDAYRRQYEQQVRLDESNRALRSVNGNIIEMFAQLIENRDRQFGSHVRLVKGFSYMLAKQVMEDWPEYGLTMDDVIMISHASPMHDVGKIAIPDSILMKHGALTPEEFEIVKTHSVKGYEILKNMDGYLEPRYLELCRQVALNHHEKWDGKGYPNGISGDDIPIAAQIVSAADIFEALTGVRGYKPRYSYTDAFTMLLNGESGEFSEKIKASIIRMRQKYGDANIGAVADRFSSVGPSDYSDEMVDLGLLRRPEFIRGSIPIVRELTEYMPGGFFIYRDDDDQRIIFYNDIMVDLFGCESREDFEKYTGNTFRGMIHPEDYPSVLRSIGRRRTNSRGESIGHTVLRIIRRDGDIRWIDVFGHLVHTDDYGDIYFSFALDVTASYIRSQRSRIAGSDAGERERIRRLLSEAGSSGNFGRLFDGTRILLVDDDDYSRDISSELLSAEGAVVTTVTNGAEALSAVRRYDRFDLILMDIVMPIMNGVDATYEIIEYYRSAGARCPIIGLTADGSSMVNELLEAGAFECLYKPLDISQLSSAYISYARYISSLLQDELAGAINRANTDPLTHVKSLSAYAEVIENINGQISSGNAKPFAIVWCDCDGLKTINDTYGHAVGDIYIKNNCGLICRTFAHSPVFRVGGDEFAVLLMGSDYENADQLASDLHHSVQKARDLSSFDDGKASLSFGLAKFDPETDRNVSDVIKRADTYMYTFKKK